MLRAIFAAMLLSATASDIAFAEPLDPKAEEVIARARTPESTYTIFWRVRIADPSSKTEYAWGATFRRGSFVRMEDLRWRVVADCSAGTGTQYHLSIGNDYLTGSKVAKRHCGINEDRKLSARWLGQQESKFGLVDLVQVVNQDGTDTYQVTAAGEVVGVTSTYRGSNVTVVAEPTSFERSLPDGDLFSRRSLATSMVPKKVQSEGSRSER
jgi:hypothetical protein